MTANAPIRLCIVNNVLADPAGDGAMQTMVDRCTAGTLMPGTTAEIRGLKYAPTHLEAGVDYYRDSYFQMLATVEIVRTILDAERAGFDAVVVNCFDDPGVEQARSCVRIPVVGIGAASLFFAAQVGRRVGLIVPNLPGQVAYATRQIADLGLLPLLIPDGIRIDSMPFGSAWVEAMGDQAAAIRRFEPLARTLVEDGADCVVFGCGGFSLVCGAQQFDRVHVGGRDWPVIVPLTVALLQAELLVRLQRSGAVLDGRIRGSMQHDPATTALLMSRFGVERPTK